jgi:hypothetical protein
MDSVQCLKLFDGKYRDIWGHKIVFTSSELGWEIAVNDSVLDGPDDLWCEFVRQIQIRLLVLKAFPCEAADAPEVAVDEEPEWDNELVPEVWNW